MLIFFLFIFAPDLHDISYMTKIVVASDSFKGSLSSAETAQAISAGINDAYPGCSVRSLFLGDGGEGTAESIAAILGGRWTTIEVNDPVGRRIKARYAICEEDMTAIIDLAEASGLTLIEENARNPLHTSTYGTGEMIMDAVRRGCRHVIIGLGGSATNDGGTGMLEALGFRFLDADGKTIERCCGNNLCDIVSIDTSDVPDELLASSFTAACDVGTVFCGEEGATRVFAPQKGAGENEIELLEKGMVSLCEVIRRQTGKDLSGTEGSGAAGGAGGALYAFLGARLTSGADLVLDCAGFEEAIKDADLIITGEGKIDSQTFRGKLPAAILKRAVAANIPVAAIGGIVDLDVKDISSSGFLDILPIQPVPAGPEELARAMRPAAATANIRRTIRELLSRISTTKKT